MEPPAKRLRILQSVEVDETNPDYIAAKQKQQQKLKGRLESLFAKYEGMHESMSDEIDFKTGKLVVDRGHLRRVQRQMKRKEPTLIDTLLEPALARDDVSEEGEERPESEDELAPTQIQKRRRDRAGDQERGAQTAERHGVVLATSPSHAAPTEPLHKNAPQIPNTPNSAANLLQHIQFPQTPLGQQAQAAFYANLNQTIAQAVQQAVAPLLSSVFQTTPIVQPAQLPVFPAPSPCPSAIDNVRPATDPKWYFPPMSATEHAGRIEHQRSSPPAIHKALPDASDQNEASSPLVSRRRSPQVRIQRKRASETKRNSPVLQVSSERPQSSHSLPALNSTGDTCLVTEPPIGESLRFKKGPRATRKKYEFTEEDDVYIIEKRELHNRSFKEIKDSKEKWLNWPASALYNHWTYHLKDRKSHLSTTSRIESLAPSDSSIPTEHEEHFFSSKEIPETSSASHRLPTPSSLEQDENHAERAVIPSSSHFDDDELELLSLAGADISDSLLTHTVYDNEDTYPTPDEPLPSIEGAEFRNEDELQLEMLKTEQSPTPEPTLPKALPSTIPETQESLVVISSPSQRRRSGAKTKPQLTYRAAPDSDDDLDLIGTNDEPTTPHAQTYTNIKRESLTPQASRFLCSSPAFKTPRPLPQSSSAAAKSTGKLDRRAYLKEVKQSWAKGKGQGRTPGSQKRRSLNVIPVGRKRAWAEVEVGDSEDELAV